jgi:hypothetical protein
MATEAQILANRLNAQESTGPRTPEGKAAVAQNAVKHGLSGRLDVIKGEDQAEFDLHRGAMLGELAPAGPMEAMLAERVVGLSWRLERVERIHNEVFDALLADRNSPLAKLVRSLEPKAAGQPKDGPDGEGDLDLGRAVIKDFSNSRVLDRLLMYERRIEHSLYKTMAELQRLRLVRELDGTAEESVCSVPAWGERPRSPKEVGRGRPTYEEPTDHSNIPSFQHSIDAPGEEERLTASLRADGSCKTKPICLDADKSQVPDNTEVKEDSPENERSETKPISEGEPTSAAFDLRTKN